MPALVSCAACKRLVKPGDAVCPFCRTARAMTPLRRRAQRVARREVALAIALGACGGVVDIPREKDAGMEAATDSGSTNPFFDDASTPIPSRDASEEIALPPPVYGAPPPPPED